MDSNGRISSDSVMNMKRSQRAHELLSDRFFHSQEYRIFHRSGVMERLVTDAIQKGDVSILLDADIPAGDETGVSGTLSKEPVRQKRYMFVTSAAIFSRAAIEGGLPRETALSMADSYIQTMDEMEERGDFELLTAQMLLHFCDEVSRCRSDAQFSRVTREACRYIEQHLHEEIRIQDVCDAVHISPNRLTEHFRRDIGSSPMEYAHQKKLQEAEYLLLYSDLSLSAISSHLGYSSQNYFTVKFRQQYGITPGRFRASTNRPGFPEQSQEIR